MVKLHKNKNNLRIFVHLAMTNGLTLKCTDVNRIRWENFEILNYSFVFIHALAHRTRYENRRIVAKGKYMFPGKTSTVYENLHKNETFVKILKHCVFLRSAI